MIKRKTRYNKDLELKRKPEKAVLGLLLSRGAFHMAITEANIMGIPILNSAVMAASTLTNMAKRSRYFIVNPGHIDRPDRTGGQSEISFRYFEGAASGTIMIGEHPKSEEFRELFNWPEAVIHLPFGSDKIKTIINELDRQPDRQEKIRRNNMVQSLLRHDWVYRWEIILETAGLKPMPELLERKKRLRDLSNMIEKRAVSLGN